MEKILWSLIWLIVSSRHWKTVEKSYFNFLTLKWFLKLPNSRRDHIFPEHGQGAPGEHLPPAAGWAWYLGLGVWSCSQCLVEQVVWLFPCCRGAGVGLAVPCDRVEQDTDKRVSICFLYCLSRSFFTGVSWGYKLYINLNAIHTESFSLSKCWQLETISVPLLHEDDLCYLWVCQGWYLFPSSRVCVWPAAHRSLCPFLSALQPCSRAANHSWGCSQAHIWKLCVWQLLLCRSELLNASWIHGDGK